MTIEYGSPWFSSNFRGSPATPFRTAASLVFFSLTVLPRRLLVVSKSDSGKPVGPGSTIDYTITVRNIGNAPAKDVSITDPVPPNTTFVSADHGGISTAGNVRWTNLDVPAGGQLQVHFSVRISSSLPGGTAAIVNDGITVRSQGLSVSGSPHTTRIAPQFAVSATPAEQSGGAKVGTSATYQVTVTNNGYATDSYTLATSGSFSETEETRNSPSSTTNTWSGVFPSVMMRSPAATGRRSPCSYSQRASSSPISPRKGGTFATPASLRG